MATARNIRQSNARMVIIQRVDEGVPLGSGESTVKFAEVPSQHDRDPQNARAEDEHVRRPTRLEASDPGHEDEADGEIEEPPEDIDGRGRQPFPRRGGERALERKARDSVHEMRDGVGEEGAREKVSDVVVPARHVISSTLCVARPDVFPTRWVPGGVP